MKHLLDLHVVMHVLLDAWWRLSQFRSKVKETRPVVIEAAQLTGRHSGMRAQDTLNRCGLEQSLQHATGATMLQALVRSEAVLGAIASVAELAHVERVRLFVLVLEVALQRVVAGEGAMAVRTLLWFIDAATGGRWHPELLLGLSRVIGVTLGVAVDLLDHVVTVAAWAQVKVVVAVHGAGRGLLGIGGHGRGSCGRVNAVDS